MAKLPSVLIDMNTFFLDESFAGIINEMTLPDIVFKSEDIAASGFAGVVTRLLGRLEKLESEVSIASYDRRVTSMIGNPEARNEMMIVRGAVDDDGEVAALVVRFSGLWVSNNLGSIKPESVVDVKAKVVIEHLEVELGGVEHIYIDKPTNVVRMGGVDLTAKIRAALGQ